MTRIIKLLTNPITSILLLLFYWYSFEVFAYDNITTHPSISAQTIVNSNFHHFIINKLNFSDGIKHVLHGESVKDEIQQFVKNGSLLEDEPDCRASNHFHNPLEPWGEAFLTDDNETVPGWMSAKAVCGASGWHWDNRQSNITWATGLLDPAGTMASYPVNSETEPFNWNMARDKFFQALTASNFLDERDGLFAETFSTIGHILHLLQDVSVPAHVRNDFTSHLIFNGINSSDVREWVKQPFEYYIRVLKQFEKYHTKSMRCGKKCQIRILDATD